MFPLSELRSRFGLNAQQIAAYGILHELATGGRVSISKAQLGVMIGVKERQAGNVLAGLKAKKLIESERIAGASRGANSYVFANPDQQPIAVRQPDAEAQPPAERQPDAGNQLPYGNDEQAIACRTAIEETSPAHARVEDPSLGDIPTGTPTPAPEPNPEPSETGIESLSCRNSILRLLPPEVLRIVESVASPKLDPTKASGLVTNARHVENWLKAGLSEADIAEVILAKLSKPNGCGEFVQCWTYFDKPMRALITKRKREAAKAKAQTGAAPCFDELWAMWPAKGRKRSDKAAALEALTKRTEAPEAILKTARTYLAETEVQFVKGLDGWLKRRLDGCLDQTPTQGGRKRQAWVIEMEEKLARERSAAQ